MEPLNLPKDVTWPLVLGIPAGLAGAAIGRHIAPKGYELESAVQQGIPGYMAGSGIGAGLQLAEHAPGEWKLPAQLAAIIGGGLGGHQVGKLMAGRPQWERKKDIVKSVNKAVEHKLEEHEKESAANALISYFAGRKALKAVFGEHEKVSAGPALLGLQEAKARSDVRDYAGKHAKLRQLLEKYPSDFYIDSQNGNIVGITHARTGFQIHAPMNVLPPGIRRKPQEQLDEKELINATP